MHYKNELKYHFMRFFLPLELAKYQTSSDFCSLTTCSKAFPYRPVPPVTNTVFLPVNSVILSALIVTQSFAKHCLFLEEKNISKSHQ